MRDCIRVLAAVALAVGLGAPAGGADYSDYSGAELYRRFCASCHGASGEGNGPVSRGLTVAVPDLTRISLRHDGHYPDNWVYRVIDGRAALLSHGPRDMPVWGVELWREQGADVSAGAKTRDAVARLVDYLRTLQVPPTLAEPPR